LSLRTSERDQEVDKDKKDSDLVYPKDDDKVRAYIKDILNTIDDRFNESTVGIKMRIDGVVLSYDEFLELAMSDAMKALFSMTFVFIYLNIHMQSCILSCLGMGIIMLSFPFTAIITNGILQIKYFGFLQIMIIYIVLGIAADDIFVFFDAWNQSAHIDPTILDTR
jgi:hypothetical protein